MDRNVKQVSEFHKLFNHPILEEPKFPDKKRYNLRVNLIEEETKELIEAISQGNLVEVADALVDLQYVVAGAMLEFGFGEISQELFDEVHRSNLSKACTSRQEAEETIHQEVFLQDTEVEDYEIEEIDSRIGQLFLVKRRSDGKLIKSKNYSTADLKKIVFKD